MGMRFSFDELRKVIPFLDWILNPKSVGTWISSVDGSFIWTVKFTNDIFGQSEENYEPISKQEMIDWVLNSIEEEGPFETIEDLKNNFWMCEVLWDGKSFGDTWYEIPDLIFGDNAAGIFPTDLTPEEFDKKYPLSKKEMDTFIKYTPNLVKKSLDKYVKSYNPDLYKHLINNWFSKENQFKDSDPRLEIAKQIYNKQHPSGKLLSFEEVYKLDDPFISYTDYSFKSYSKENEIIWLVDNDILDPEDFNVETKEELKEILKNKSNNELLQLSQELADELAGPQQLYELNTIQGLKNMLEEAEEWEADDEEVEKYKNMKEHKTKDLINESDGTVYLGSYTSYYHSSRNVFVKLKQNEYLNFNTFGNIIKLNEKEFLENSLVNDCFYEKKYNSIDEFLKANPEYKEQIEKIKKFNIQDKCIKNDDIETIDFDEYDWVGDKGD